MRPSWSFAITGKIALSLCYVVLWIGGIYTAMARVAAPAWASPLFLLLAAAIAAIASGEVATPLVFAAGGFLAEVIGVHNGVPFGRYSYSKALGPSVAGVPLAIGCAWVVLLLFARDLASRITAERWRASAAGGLLMTAFDCCWTRLPLGSWVTGNGTSRESISASPP